jgi:hypothetical protein
MKKANDLKGTYTVTVKDSDGKELNTIIKKGSVEDRKMIYLSFMDDSVDYFEVAEQYIKNNFLSGDNLFADDEALFSACTRINEMIQFDSAKLIATPVDVDAHFTIEATDADGKTLVAHFAKPSVATKKKLFKLITKGTSNPFSLGEVVLLESFVDGDDLTQDKEVFTSASMIASSYVEYNEAYIKKN